jgi:hypothetical protein
VAFVQEGGDRVGRKAWSDRTVPRLPGPGNPIDSPGAGSALLAPPSARSAVAWNVSLRHDRIDLLKEKALKANALRACCLE